MAPRAIRSEAAVDSLIQRVEIAPMTLHGFGRLGVAQEDDALAAQPR